MAEERKMNHVGQWAFSLPRCLY